MDLRRKLARLSGAAATAPVASAAPVVEAPPVSEGDLARAATIERLRRAIAALNRPDRPARGPDQAAGRGTRALALEQRETPHGALHVRDHVFEPAHRHGCAEVRAALAATPSDIAALALDPSLRDVDPRSMLLVDTETTGLSGGTGTLPFLVGMGWFEGDRLRLTQLLLRRPGEERPILAFFAERLASASVVVTYNGKSFDWPLLKNRCVMNRLRPPDARPHLDLLHCARRVFRHRLVGARLVQLEEEVLGFSRVGDVPGDQIPERYFRYLRGGDSGLLAPVLEHNAHDLALLAALLGVLAREFSSRPGERVDARVSLGYAQVAERAGDDERALAFARGAWLDEDARAVRAEALALGARVLRRRGDPRGAAELLERAAGCSRRDAAGPIHLELAKLYEHHLRDLTRALAHARQCPAAEPAHAHARRLARLEERVARAAVPVALGA